MESEYEMCMDYLKDQADLYTERQERDDADLEADPEEQT